MVIAKIIEKDMNFKEQFLDKEYENLHSFSDQRYADSRYEIEECVKNNIPLKRKDYTRESLQDLHAIRADLKYCDFSRSDLSGAHMYGVNLKGGKLFKANLEKANLNGANLEDCDLLGANLEETKLENVNWGKNNILISETEALKFLKLGLHENAMQKFREAEETYRNIKLAYRNRGHGKEESNFFYREMVVNRQQLPFLSWKRFWSKCMDMVAGYGERPGNVIFTMWTTILLFGFMYGLTSVTYFNRSLSFFSDDLTIPDKVVNLLYFSTVVFTTVGIGDIYPLNLFSKGLVIVEGFIGPILMAIFIIALYKKIMSR